jgi:hypothetical protein
MNQTTQKSGTVNGVEIQMHLDKIYEELISDTYGKRLK